MEKEFIYGRVDWYDSYKGFGTIVLPNKENIFVHKSQVIGTVKNNDFVQIDSITSNIQKKRKECIKTKKITLDVISKLSNDFSRNNYNVVVNFYRCIEINELQKFAITKTYDFLVIETHDHYKFSSSSLNYKKCINCNLFSLCDYKKGIINMLKIE